MQFDVNFQIKVNFENEHLNKTIRSLNVNIWGKWIDEWNYFSCEFLQ